MLRTLPMSASQRYFRWCQRLKANAGRTKHPVSRNVLTRFAKADYQTKQRLAKQYRISVSTMYRRLKAVRKEN